MAQFSPWPALIQLGLIESMVTLKVNVPPAFISALLVSVQSTPVSALTGRLLQVKGGTIGVVVVMDDVRPMTFDSSVSLMMPPDCKSVPVTLIVQKILASLF